MSDDFLGLTEEDDEKGVWIRPDNEVRESDVPSLNEELAAELKGVCDDLVYHLYMIDLLLEKYKKALTVIQPHATGRIDIKYWRGYLPGKHPTAVVYRCLGPGRTLPLPKGQKKDRNQSLSKRTSKKLVYAPFRLKRENLVKRAKRSGKFLESLEQTQFVLGKIDSLLTMRGTVVENMRRFRMSLTKAMQHQNKVMQVMEDEADGLMPGWKAFAETRYDELSDRRRDHLIMLEQEDARQARRGFTFGKKPGKPEA